MLVSSNPGRDIGVPLEVQRLNLSPRSVIDEKADLIGRDERNKLCPGIPVYREVTQMGSERAIVNIVFATYLYVESNKGTF